MSCLANRLKSNFNLFVSLRVEHAARHCCTMPCQRPSRWPAVIQGCLIRNAARPPQQKHISRFHGIAWQGSRHESMPEFLITDVQWTGKWGADCYWVQCKVPERRNLHAATLAWAFMALGDCLLSGVGTINMSQLTSTPLLTIEGPSNYSSL